MRWNFASVTTAECHLCKLSCTQHSDRSIDVHLVPISGTYVRQHGILDNSPIEKLHDVKGSTDDRVIFTKAICLGYRDIGRLECVQDSVLAFNFVRRLGEELSGRLLA